MGRVIRLVTTGSSGPGINGGMMKRRGSAPGEGQPMNGMSASSKLVRSTTLPGIGWSAYFKDIEGNIFGIFQSS